MRQRDEELAGEVEALKRRVEEVEQLIKEQPKSSSIFNIHKSLPKAQEQK